MTLEEILARSLIALAVTVAGVVGYRIWRSAQLRRVSDVGPATPGLVGWQPGRRAIVYFTTPDCAPCRTTQRPVLRRLEADLGGAVQVIEIDASVERAVADHWGVLSVPTTFVLADNGRPEHVNIGVTGYDRLKQQLAVGSTQTATA